MTIETSRFRPGCPWHDETSILASGECGVCECELADFIFENVSRAGQTRMFNCLVWRAGFRTVEQVRGLSFRDLMSIKNFGKKQFGLLQLALGNGPQVVLQDRSVGIKMEKLKIEKNIPIPNTAKRPGAYAADAIPWDEMQVGDSVIFRHNASGLKKRAAKHGLDILIKGHEPLLGAKGAQFSSWRIWCLGKRPIGAAVNGE